jgi:threonine 3-dehydrogenase
MKALVKARAEPGIWMQDVPEPKVGHNDVLIKVHRSAICGTDMHIYNWDAWAQKSVPVPMAVGHALPAGIAATAEPAGAICAATPPASGSIGRAHSPNT